MRILLTTDTVGGVWDYTRILAESLCAAGHKVLLAVLGDAAADRRGPLPSCVEVAARPYRLEWMPDSAADVEASTAWIEELALEWRPVVVHLNRLRCSSPTATSSPGSRRRWRHPRRRSGANTTTVSGRRCGEQRW